MSRYLLALTLSLAQVEASVGGASPVRLNVIADAYPARPRVRGYEFNQKGHRDKPTLREGSAVASRRRLTGMRSYRVVGLRLENSSGEEVRVVLRSPQLRNNRRFEVRVPANDFVRRYFVVREDGVRSGDGESSNGRFVVEVVDERNRVLERQHAEYGAGDHRVRNPFEALAVVQELEREESQRRRLSGREVEVQVRDELGRPVPGAQVWLIHDKELMVYEGTTDASGFWQVRVLPGAYEVLALRDIPRDTRPGDRTRVLRPRRLLAVRETLRTTQREISLEPSRTVELSVIDADGRDLNTSRLWITPDVFSEAYRYETVSRRLGASGRLEIAESTVSRYEFLTDGGSTWHVAAGVSWNERIVAFLRARISRRTGETSKLVFDPKRLARIFVDPPAGAGPGKSSELELVAVGEGFRESIRIAGEGLRTAYLHPGDYRATLDSTLVGGGTAEFLPFAFSCRSREIVDLTPRGPVSVAAYHWRVDGKLQFWVAVRDGTGRVLARKPHSAARRVSRRGDGKRQIAPFDKGFRWELFSGSDEVTDERHDVGFEIPFGQKLLKGVLRTREFDLVKKTHVSGIAPAALKSNLETLLPEVKRSVDSCLQTLGLPRGKRDIRMVFNVFMPPGIGGLGGGGQVILGMPRLQEFVTPTDALPGAFRHELGHCLGFGHDPYMLLASCGVDEGRFGTIGYAALHSGAFRQTIAYLHRERRHDDGWSLRSSVFPALRVLFGPAVHHDMLMESDRWEELLKQHKLSSLERIATFYSVVTNENVAWVFRAHGWPVLDTRVRRGVAVLYRNRGAASPPELELSDVGTPLQSWWVYHTENESWRPVAWPEAFTFLDENRETVGQTRDYALFRRFSSRRSARAYLVCASDVQLEISLNGTQVGTVDAFRQWGQPAHDDFLRNPTHFIPVEVFQGENYLDLAVRQPAGTKGFLLGLVTPSGKRLPIGLEDEGPPGEDAETKIVRVRPRDPVYNGSFDAPGGGQAAWTEAAGEGNVSVQIDRGKGARGSDCLHLALGGDARGGLIQRVIVKPNARYRLSAFLRCRELRGEAYVKLFRGDPSSYRVRTDPVTAVNASWKRHTIEWVARDTRTIYVGCYIEGTGGSVWFDEVHLEEVR